MKRNQTLHEWLIPALCSELGAARYLELGCHENETVAGVREAAPDCHVYAVDQRAPSEFLPGVNYRIMPTAKYLAESAAADGPFNIVFIDADHKAESALADFDAVWPHVAPEGLVLLHDTNPERLADTAPGFCGDSWRAAETLKVLGHECVTLPYHPGLTIVRKRLSWGPADPASLTAGKETTIALV